MDHSVQNSKMNTKFPQICSMIISSPERNMHPEVAGYVSSRRQFRKNYSENLSFCEWQLYFSGPKNPTKNNPKIKILFFWTLLKNQMSVFCARGHSVHNEQLLGHLHFYDRKLLFLARFFAFCEGRMRFSQVSKCFEKQNELSCHSQNDNPAKLVIVFANTIFS